METEQFYRTEMLLGSEGVNRLRKAHIAVIGCGAVGGFAIEALARAGIGKFTLIDGDTVEPSNINRQICALHSTIGQPKTEVLKNRIKDICPDTIVQVHTIFLSADNIEDLLSDRPDFVVDAIDILKDKIDLILWLEQKGIPFISSMGAARKTDWQKIKISALNQTSVCPLAAKLRKMLKSHNADLSFPCVYSTESPIAAQGPNRQMGSLMTITGQFGLIIANEVISRIVNNV